MYKRRAIDVFMASISGANPYSYALTVSKVIDIVLPGWYDKIKNNTCPICGKKFVSSRGLIGHLRLSRCRKIAEEIMHLVDTVIRECVDEVVKKHRNYDYDGVRYATRSRAIVACARKKLLSSRTNVGTG